MSNIKLNRRQLLARAFGSVGALVLGGCNRLSETSWFPAFLESADRVSLAAHRLLLRGNSMAQEFSEADLSPTFRSNGTGVPNSADYTELSKKDFVDYRMKVDGLVERPANLSLAELRALPSRTQITRHDCVEGWSAIGKWKGVPLATILDAVKPKPEARYVVFHCADPMETDGSNPYYESIDLEDARHPQTILAYELNDKTLPIPNGAPIRVRVERQLGYKHAKYIMRIELVSSFDRIGGGKGGYWEDQGYQWYAGI